MGRKKKSKKQDVYEKPVTMSGAPTITFRTKVLDCSSFYDNPLYSDAIIKFKDCDQVIHVNKLLLASISPVFKRMFESGMNESKTNEIVIDEMKGIKHMIKWIYDGVIDLSGLSFEECFDLFGTAHLYQVEEMVDGLNRYIPTTVNELNAREAYFQLFPFVTDDNLKPINATANHMLRNIAKKINKDDLWRDMDAPIEFLTTALTICANETDMVNMISKWRNECTKSTDEDVIYLLKMVDFAKVEGTLTMKTMETFPELASHIAQCLLTRFKSVANPKPTPAFHSFGFRDSLEFKRSTSDSSGWTYSGMDKIDSLDFSFSKLDGPCMLTGIQMFAASGSEYTIKLEIINRENKEKLYSNQFTFTKEDNSLDYQLLEVDLDITEGVWYGVVARIQGADSPYGSNCQSSITQEGRTLSIRSADDCTNGTTTSSGQFRSFVFDC